MNQDVQKDWAGNTETLFQVGGEKTKLLIYDYKCLL